MKKISSQRTIQAAGYRYCSLFWVCSAVGKSGKIGHLCSWWRKEFKSKDQVGVQKAVVIVAMIYFIKEIPHTLHWDSRRDGPRTRPNQLKSPTFESEIHSKEEPLNLGYFGSTLTKAKNKKEPWRDGFPGLPTKVDRGYCSYGERGQSQ